jgi:hypothetical protein
MHRTLNTLRLFVVAAALLVAVLAAPAAQAQSVKGSGTFNHGFGNSDGYEYKVNVAVGSNGTVHGSVSYRSTSFGSGKWTTYSALSLAIVGNQATVTTVDGPIFVFTDNGDGSVQPDVI